MTKPVEISPAASRALDRHGTCEPGYPVLMERVGEDNYYLMMDYSEERWHLREGWVRAPAHILEDELARRAAEQAEKKRIRAEQDAEYRRRSAERRAAEQAYLAAENARYEAEQERYRLHDEILQRMSHAERNALIYRDRVDGMTLQEIGDKYFICPARVRQICKSIVRRRERMRERQWLRGSGGRIQGFPGDELFRDIDMVYTVGPDPRRDWMVAARP